MKLENDIQKMAQEVAQRALDEFTYKGKTVRQWIDIIAEYNPAHAYWKWEDVGLMGFHDYEATCSACGYKIGDGMNTKDSTRFCPGCGARMDGDSHDSGQ